MDKNLPKDPLEEFFRKSLETNSDLPSDDGWDLPSEGVWDRVEEHIQPTTILRPINYWKWTAIAASITLLFFVYQWINNKKEIEQLTVELKLNQLELENTKELLQKEIDKKENVLAEEDNDPSTDKPGNESDQDVAENLEANPPVNSKKSTGSTSYSGQHSNSIPIHSTNETVVENKNEIIENQNKDDFPQTNPDNSKNIISNEQPNSIVEKTFETLEILPSRYFGIENTQSEESLIIDFSSMAALEFVRSKTEKGFYLGAFASRNFGNRTITGRRTGADNDRRKILRESRDREYWTTGGGMKLGYKLSKNWSLESGFQYTKMEMDIRNRVVRKFTQAGETIVNGEFQNDYALLIVTPFGDAGSDITLSRNTMIADQMPFQVTLDSRVNVSFIGVPLVAKYSIGNEKFRAGFKLGAMSNFVLDSDIQVRRITLQTPLLFQRKHVVRDKKEIKNLETATLDFIAGFELEAKVGESLYFSLEPSLTRSLTPIFEKQDVKTYPSFTNVRMGLNYYF